MEIEKDGDPEMKPASIRCGSVLCRDRRFYRRQPQDAVSDAESCVRRRKLRQRNEQELTQNVDAAAAAGTGGNQTNSTYI
ncbi:hypothetical protein IGI04_030112 [Brassica rapa subsp. trilocularis]|uniref:Uncharacterized protein n=1 Tax=Brassica rapa subsp. trilocularis TaxID=1813537 RepID=A0ABQ7LS43_BRACM|nr:hypothetical protein IGI04_030112 [Brassica rapa subsp. trilocularis]